MIAVMIAAKTLKRAGMLGLMAVNALQSLTRQQGAGRAAGQRCRSLTRPSAPSGIRARVTAILTPGCLLPHVEPFNITASALVPTDAAPNAWTVASPNVSGIESSPQQATPALLLAYARVEQECWEAVPA